MNGEMIENAIRTGKIEEEEHTKKSNYRRRDNEVINTCVYNVGYTKQLTVGQPKAATSNVQNSSKKGSSQRTKAEDMEFTPIPMSYGELYKNLYNAHVVSPFYIKPIQPPYPKWYDADAHCDHHAGVTGHSIENCPAFKRLVEKIIKMGVVRFDDSAGSSTSENPLPVHAESGANAIVEGNKKIKTTMEDVKTLLRWVWKKMIEMGMLQKIAGNVKETSNDCCPYHGKKDHDIQNCAEFKTLIQQLVDNKELEFFEERLVEEAYICTSEYRNKNLEDNYPVIVISGPRKYGKGESSQAKVTIEKPVPFPYHDSRKVPWKYNCEVSIQGEEALKTTSKDVNDVGFFTRSGRRYVPKEAEDPKEKAPVNVEPESLVNEPVKEEEVKEFLKFLKHSEYNVVEHLRKMPARISILTLLLNSEAHRNTLLKVLNETFVPNDILVNKLDRLVNNINADNFIYFHDDEIPAEGTGSTKALHITTRCKGYTLPGVLIDNGSALNVLPLVTLSRLPIDSSHMKTCNTLVRAFDGTERKVMGRIEVPLLVGPNTYDVDVIVMDIKPTYNCLLGRPWIHSAGAVPSSLHQKLKFIFDGRLVTVNAEEDIIASITSEAPYIETDEKAEECSFRSFEFVNATFIPEGSHIPTPRLSNATRVGIKLTIGR
ncbi:hypothetical protein HRI_001715400 [Hibiscus trionum]|uniref:Gag-pro-like protein n=1 Tax=Hibiscus trionum TaxID=183268 RepID=A0A9W7LWK5_HIBTR|nr:hypothetical protein HRI_001715400 [Hibiscus trionum]